MEIEAYPWKGLDTFGDRYDKINWSKGTTGVFFHKLCHLNLKSERKLEQAKKRSEKDKKTVSFYPKLQGDCVWKVFQQLQSNASENCCI